MGEWRLGRNQAFAAALALALTAAPAWGQGTAPPAPAAPDAYTQIQKLSAEALDSIDDALNSYGQLKDFGDRYGTATRALLEELIAEWTIATEITEAIAPETEDPRLIQIRTLLSGSRSDSEAFVNLAKERSKGLVAADNALRFRHRQIALYQHLLGGLKRDRDLLKEVQQLSATR